MTMIAIAANQGQIGGGEIMLLALADACRTLGHDVTVVGPRSPSDVIEQARARGHRTVAIDGATSARYLANLRRWNAHQRDGLLWANGLRPALATAGHRRRVVHLHQLPTGKLTFVARLAQLAAETCIVPSHYVANSLPGAQVLWNWTEDVTPKILRSRGDQPLPHTIGYLGRLSRDKGVVTLCEAIVRMASTGRPLRLLLAGEARFTSDEDAAAIEAALGALDVIVERPGWMEREDFFAQCDLAVFPSVAPESFGLVVAEAMAARCPFVISDAGALPEIAGADHPFVARRGESADLARAIIHALETDPAPFIEAARARWEEHFCPRAGYSRLEALLEGLAPAERNHL